MQDKVPAFFFLLRLHIRDIRFSKRPYPVDTGNLLECTLWDPFLESPESFSGPKAIR